MIQAAGTRALAAGTRVDRRAGHLRGTGSAPVPVVLMTYANLVLARGVETFAADAAAAGASGLIVPDLPLEEAPAALAACDAAGLALVPLVAPTTTDERLARIGERARGFVYTVSVDRHDGRAGGRSRTRSPRSSSAPRPTPSVPVALGFGIATPEQASAAADAGADGVIIGSRLVREATEAGRSRGRDRGARRGVRPGPPVASGRVMGFAVAVTFAFCTWIVLYAVGREVVRRLPAGADHHRHRRRRAHHPEQVLRGTPARLSGWAGFAAHLPRAHP